VEPCQLVRADSLEGMPEGQGFPGFHLGDDQPGKTDAARFILECQVEIDGKPFRS